jgi:hypothetical protein
MWGRKLQGDTKMSIQQIDRSDYPSVGPRITPEAIERNIASEHYFTAYEGVIGERFVHERGEGAEEPGTVPQSLELLTICVLTLQNGFTVTGESACADIGEALTMMTAHRLGNQEAFKPEHAETILAHFEGRGLKEDGSN